MQDLINLVMLICASVAAMAFGVLAAYGICRVAFAVLRIHARSVAGTFSVRQGHLKSGKAVS